MYKEFIEGRLYVDISNIVLTNKEFDYFSQIIKKKFGIGILNGKEYFSLNSYQSHLEILMFVDTSINKVIFRQKHFLFGGMSGTIINNSIVDFEGFINKLVLLPVLDANDSIITSSDAETRTKLVEFKTVSTSYDIKSYKYELI